MKKHITLNIDYAGGESCFRPESACDFMLVESILGDAPVEELYVEVNPEEIPGEGHYAGEGEDREWVFDDECASEPILYQLLADEAASKGFEVLYCGAASDVPAELRAIENFNPANRTGRILIVSYDADDEVEA